MSRSLKKSLFHSCTASQSEKWDKINWYRRFRRKNKINSNIDYDNTNHVNVGDGFNVYLFSKDGKCYFGNKLRTFKHNSSEMYMFYQKLTMK